MMGNKIKSAMTARLLLSYGNVDQGETRALGKERH